MPLKISRSKRRLRRRKRINTHLKKSHSQAEATRLLLVARELTKRAPKKELKKLLKQVERKERKPVLKKRLRPEAKKPVRRVARPEAKMRKKCLAVMMTRNQKRKRPLPLPKSDHLSINSIFKKI